LPRKRTVTGVVAILLGGAAVALWLGPVRALLGEGSTRIEAWCGRQLVAIAGDHLTPTLVLGEVDYMFPKTLHVNELSLEADGISIIAADSARLEFAEIPRPGRPLVISAVTLVRPVVRLIEDVDGALVGFGNIVKPGPGRELDDGGSTRLSDVLKIERFDVTGGMLEYTEHGEPPMLLEPLTFELNREVAPETVGSAWYSFDTVLALAPVAVVDAKLRFNLDTVVLDLESVDLTTTLGPEHYEIFPPRIQAFLRDRAIKGSLTASASGVVPTRDALASELTFQVRLEAASTTFGDYVLPVEVLTASGRMSGGLLEIESARLDALGGQAEFAAGLWLDDPAHPFRVRGHGLGLLIEESVTNPESDLAGRIDFTIDLGARASDLPASLVAQGDIDLTEGTVANRPWSRALMRSLAVAPLGGGTDSGHCLYTLTPDHVHFGDIEMVVNQLGIRGEGELYYDGTLDLRIAAGPLERFTGKIGGVGDVLGSITDRLNTYHITGPVTSPEVKVRPLGIGVKKPKKAEPSEEP
jgi:hypothetical protein